MQILRVTILLLLISLLREPVCAEESANRTMANDLSSEISLRVDKLVDQGKIAGAVTLVSQNGKTIHFTAEGSRDVNTDEAMTPETIFRIYSMTKPITTAATMQLVEQGKLALEDPVSRHLPELANPVVFRKGGEPTPAKREPTIADLMRHTSGYSYGFVGGEVAKMYREVDILARDSSMEEMVKKLARIPLQENPGTQWRYSISIDVLGAVIEAASGEKLEHYLADHLFEPLGMVDTAFFVPEEKWERFASQHGRGLTGKLRVSEAAEKSKFLTPPGLPSGGGGLCSTATDYLRFCEMILNQGTFDGNQILKPESVALMIRNQLPDSISHIGIGDERTGVGFGYGFSVRTRETDWGFGGKVGEIGWGGAASTHFWMLPSENLAVITLRNFMPYQWTLEAELKDLIYDSIK